ncbi:MAG: helix-turn-helix domain-containing protein [Piscinibacter sp.]|uniref:IclR family transcriptional regulator domain-containing protein n=1 Tax=Piscinibacter TaxID=1114981 RepID=UPI000FDE7DFC|nr:MULTISPECIES: IclR family transcriptional regulator C-terminal domain-containing protein [Piscinibacter]MCW5663288.1 helix-turn-helix domain-containing protein [Piscinibacter sp.]
MASTVFPIDRKDLIEGLGKGLRVIEAFDEEHARLTPAEAAKRAGITRTAARRYLLSLCHFGYAASDGKLFWLMPRVLRLGQSYLEAARLPRLAQPFIQRAAFATGETVNLSVLDGHEIVYVARSGSPRLVTIGFQPGARVPAHVVTPGLAILSSFDDAALDEWLAAHEFTSFTAQGITSGTRFRKAVLVARSLGYGIAEQQLDAGLRGIALPVKNRKGQCVGAIGTTLPLTESTESMVARLLPPLQEAVQSLRQVL